LFILVLYFQVRSAACPRGEQLNGALCELVLALLANNRPGWKGLSGTKPVADLASLSETKNKSFILPTVGCQFARFDNCLA